MKKLRAKGRAVLRAKEYVKVPHFNPLNYDLSMIHALNYYNCDIDDDSKKRKFAYDYWKSLGKNVDLLNPLSDYWFHTIGAVAHMASGGIPLRDHDIIRLDNSYEQLLGVAKQSTVSKTGPKTTIQDRTNEIVSKHIGEVEAALDSFIGSGTEFDMKVYIQKNEVKGSVSKRIGEWFKPKMKEFQSALTGEDSDLKEAYSFMGKVKLKKVIEFIANIVGSCDNMAMISKTMRKPRVKKPQPPGKLVAKMKFLRDFPELNMKSVDPTKIIGSTQVWVYNTRLRRLFKYEALDGMEFSVKGTTLQNWNPEKSGSKIMRKPEVQLKDVGGMTKRPLNNMFNEVKATMGKATGRLNDDSIIVGVF